MRVFGSVDKKLPVNKFTKLNEEENEVLEKLKWDPEYSQNRGQAQKGSAEFKSLVQERAEALRQLDKYQ